MKSLVPKRNKRQNTKSGKNTSGQKVGVNEKQIVEKKVQNWNYSVHRACLKYAINPKAVFFAKRNESTLPNMYGLNKALLNTILVYIVNSIIWKWNNNFLLEGIWNMETKTMFND